LRTSNAYLFRDPLPCAASPERAKSENAIQPRFHNPKSFDPPLVDALSRLAAAVRAREAGR
jgi:hypothetical protein